MTATITEPEPGCRLEETATGVVTTFTVTPSGAGCVVRFDSVLDEPGLGGLLLRLFIGRTLGPIYADELLRLEAHAREHAALASRASVRLPRNPVRHLAMALSLIIVAACATVSAPTSAAPTTLAAASPTAGASPSPEITPAPSPSPTEAESAAPTPAPTSAPTATAAPTPKPTPHPTPKPTLNPNWIVKAKVGNGVLTPSAGTSVDTVTWRVLSAADGARCELYLYFFTGGPGSSAGGDPVNHGNSTDGGTYHAGKSNTFVLQIAPDQHDEYATYTLGCWLPGGAKRWATPGQISMQ